MASNHSHMKSFKETPTRRSRIDDEPSINIRRRAQVQKGGAGLVLIEGGLG